MKLSCLLPITILVLVLLPLETRMQSRADIIWMRGGHTLDVRSMDYSPDGQLFASMGDNNGVVKIWRLSDGVLLRTFNVFSGSGYQVKFLPDNQTIVVTGTESNANYMRRVKASDGQLIWSQTILGGTNRIVLTPDGNIFINGNGAQFYRSSDGALLSSFNSVFYRNSNGVKVNWLGFSDGYLANSGTIAVSLFNGSGNYPAIVDPNDCYVDTNNAKYCNLIAYFPSLNSGVRAIAPDGMQILTFGGADISKIYRVSDACFTLGSCPNTIPNPVATVVGDSDGNPTFSSNGQFLAIHSLSSGAGNSFYVYNVSDWSTLFSRPHPDSYRTTVFSPDNQIVANSSNPTGATALGQVNFWRVSDGVLTRVLNSHIGNVIAVAFSPDSQRFASADGQHSSSRSDGVVHIWDSTDGALLTSFVADAQSVNAVSFSPDGRSIVTGGARGIKLWNPLDGTLIRTYGSSNSANSVAFSPDGTLLVTSGSSSGGRVTVWNVASGNPVRTFFPSPGYSLAVAVSPDGQTMAATDGFSSISTNISLWRLSDGALLQTLSTSGDVASLAFSPDNQTILAGLHENNGSDRSSSVKQWQVSTGALLRTYTGHINWVESVAFSPDGKEIMSGGVDGIRIWDASNGTQLRYYDNEIGPFPFSSSSGFSNTLSVAFSPDGSKIGYGRFDATTAVASNPYPPAPSDSTPPSSTAALSDQPNNAGWNNANFSVTVSASDEPGGSGVKSITYSLSGSQSSALTTVNGSAIDIDITSEGTTTITFFATDNANNSEASNSLVVNLDKSAPLITVIVPVIGNYLLNQQVFANYSCGDSMSGVATCIGSVANGSHVNTAGVGLKTFTVNATDLAGNTATPTTVNYSVRFAVAALYDQTKGYKSGNSIPIKIQLLDATGANVSSPGIVVHAIGVTRIGGISINQLSSAPSVNDFKYDRTFNGYSYKLSTDGLVSGTYALTFIAAGDQTSTYSIQFRIK
jgi:WD40 repeat protein